MDNKLKIRDFCGDYALDIPFTDGSVNTIYFNSKRNAETVKHIIEVDGSKPNVATVCEMEEIKHGKNLTKAHHVDEFICSECGYMTEDCTEKKYSQDGDYCYLCEYEYKFCPNCGAKMDKEEIND